MLRSMILSGVLLFVSCTFAQAAEVAPKTPEATLTVNGRGEITASPDQAVVRLGAMVQAADAAAAQNDVNRIMERAIKQVRALDVPPEMITTTGLSLEPVYSRPNSSHASEVPKVVGYRAGNTIQVQTEDMSMIGKIIDAAVSAGANRIEGISFRLKNDSKDLQQALRLAVREARAKADAIAGAMHVRIVAVREITETGAHLVQPQLRAANVYMARAETPVQPGQVQVTAGVTIRYEIAPLH